jgi:nickel-dependent lactate racemase
MQIQLEKGRETITFDIQNEKVIDVLDGKNVPELGFEKIRKIISEGIKRDTPPSVIGKKIAVLIPDDTRLWARGDLYVPEIIKSLLELGVQAADITVIIALGTHKDIPEERFEQLAGRYCVDRVRILNSANQNEKRLTSVGRTRRGTEVLITKEAVEAEHIVIFGGVLHHMAAGYGGGRKYIFPGIAGFDAIQQNHSLAMQEDGSPHPGSHQAKLAGNPLNEDLTEAAEIFLEGRTASYAAIAANGHGEIFYAAVGPLQKTFREGCRQIDDACCVSFAQKGDFALISAGGYRTDGQLYQATKALFNSESAVREGAQILFTAACSEGTGNKLFGESLSKYQGDKNSLGRELARAFSMPSYVAFRVIDLQERFDVSLLSTLEKSEVERLGFNYVEDLQKYVNNLRGKGYIIPFAENILPIQAV